MRKSFFNDDDIKKRAMERLKENQESLFRRMEEYKYDDVRKNFRESETREHERLKDSKTLRILISGILVITFIVICTVCAGIYVLIEDVNTNKIKHSPPKIDQPINNPYNLEPLDND